MGGFRPKLNDDATQLDDDATQLDGEPLTRLTSLNKPKNIEDIGAFLKSVSDPALRGSSTQAENEATQLDDGTN